MDESKEEEIIKSIPLKKEEQVNYFSKLPKGIIIYNALM